MEAEAKKKRQKKPPPPPKFAAGDVVTTRHQVEVRQRAGFGRCKLLWLLPGTEWTVEEVIPPEEGSRRRQRYRLRADQFKIVRREWQLKKLR